MISILASSHYMHAVDEGQALPSLDAILKPLCREPFRRIDRFIQLALMGSAQCVGSRTLDPDCALYIGTGCGPEGNNVVVQETLFKARLLPKPFNFVNTLGSSTGYYVAKNLRIRAQTLLISCRCASTQAALLQASADMEMGIVKQALLGVVEECTLPLADHRRRMDLAPDTRLAEGSHWLLLQAGEHPDRIATLEMNGKPGTLKASGDISEGYHDSIVGSDLTKFLRDKTPGLLEINSGKNRFLVQN